MIADEIIEEMRRNDRLLKESAVVLAVQKELIKMGYEPFEERVKGIYDAINNVPKVCIMEEYDALYEKANKGGWIPCSERLPEQTEKVSVITDKGCYYIARLNTQNEWVCYAEMIDTKITYSRVIAWQPLPEAFKEGE